MMDRSREARRASGMVASSNGLSRRRHRSSGLRDSPDEDGTVELQESVRLRERVKKDRDRDRDRERDRERDRDRDRERERERERERSSRSSKRRRGERMMLHGSSTREDGGGDDSSEEESVNDDEEDEDDDNNNSNNNNNNQSNNNNNGHHNSGGVGGGGVRLLPPNPNSGPAVGSISNHYHGGNINNNHHPHSNSTNHNHQHLQHRKSFPPSTGTVTGTAKVYRAAPVWKSGEETIGVPVPRKARSASIKRSHDWMANNTGGNGGVGVGGGGGEQIHRQASTSPVRQNIVSTSTPSPAAPMSPSSSNASARKKIKPNGQKQPRPPKSSSKASSSNPEELEIEIAEVLYGLKTQSQAPLKKEILFNDSGEVNRSSSDTKSRVSSPISNSPSTNIQSSPAIQPPNSCSSAGPLSAIAPKRKRPRQVSENPGGYSVRSSPISSTAAKMEIDQTPKTENTSPNLEKAPGSESEYGYDLGNMVNTQGLPTDLTSEMMKADSELKPASAEGHGESRDMIPKEELAGSPKKESSAVKAEESNRDDVVTVTASALASSSSVTKVSSAVPEVNSQMEKFQIDLEAPPPQSRSSPERETEINSMNSEMDNKRVVAEEMKPASAQDKDDGKLSKMGSEAAVITACEEKRAKLIIEEPESQNKVRNIDLQFDLEKPERDSGMSNKHPQQQAHKQHHLPSSSKAAKDEPHGEKLGHSSSLPLPMSMASWPGGLPPMGYMAPIQGVVSMDGTTVSPAPIQSFFSQPRPKRCATHCYIARNIHYLQQFIKMNPFWPAAAAAAGSASLFGSKPLSVVPPPDLHSNLAGRAANNAQDKAQGLAIFPGHGGKDKSSQPTNSTDAGQRKQQILMQQALPPVAPNNIMHGPAAFIFPLSQQPAASARPGSVKQPTNSGNLASTSASNSAAAAASSSATAAVSFNYPNMPGNETPYLAILQNNPYHFPIPAAVGGPPPNYRGTHPQPLPMFNGSFYSSQIIHPSQLQQQPQQQSASQSQQMQQNHQNNSMSSGSSSSQKHLQSHQQRPIGGGNGSGSGNMHNFPPPKNRQQSQQPQNQQMSQSQARQLENDVGAEDSPSTADSRGARGPVNIYGQNFAMPIHPQNYALLTTPAALANANATTSSNNHQSEKKQQQSQQPGKNGVESLPPHTFAMSFASMNGATAPGIDLSSMAQNHAILQSLPEATRHNIQMMAATAAAAHAAQRKSFRISEDGKNGAVDSSNMEDDRKSLSGKPQVSSGQSIAFSRSELGDVSGSATAVNNVIDSSARSLNIASGPSWTARSTIPSNLGVASLSNAQLQHQHQPQQMMQLQKQQQLAASSAGRSKTPSTSNGSMYPEHLSSASSIAAKFPNSLSAFPQNFVQTSNSNSPTHSPQWKNSGRPNTSPAPSSFVTSTTSTLKSLPQQQGRSQQSHTQISFGSNQKTSANPQGQQAASSIQSPSSPMMVGSPSNSSISKGASGSPRTTSASASSKTGQASSLSTQQVKSSSVPGQKSSPVGGRNVPSILGNPHITSSTGQKPQMQSQQQQQLPKNMQQGQLFFSNPYMQTQSSHSTNTNAAAAAAGYYIQRRRPDQQQQPQGSSAASTGMLTLSPVSLAGAVTSDPAKAIAAATVAASNMKGGLPPQSILHTAQFATQSTGNQHQLLPAGFPYVHPVPAAIQVKPAEQKQPAGNDNLHACWQPEKK